MTSLPDLLILDVGHGNCAVLIDTNGTIVFDCATGVTLFETLEERGITEIEALLISHADTDHLSGAIGLLTNDNFLVKKIFVNPDPRKNVTWIDFRTALADAKTRGTEIIPSLTTQANGDINAGEVHIEVLAPSQELALGAVGGVDTNGKKLSPNSLSVVVSLSHKDHRLVILPGDLDSIGLENLLSQYEDLSTDIFVFPHHGGLPGSTNIKAFVERICGLHKPKVIIFSMDREKYSNPNQEIISQIRDFLPTTHLMCTQISTKCSLHEIDGNDHLINIPSKGKQRNFCCAGSIEISINGEESTYYPCNPHKEFVNSILSKIGTPMCIPPIKV